MERITAIYARQSVDKKESVSIEAQIEDCKKYAKDGHARIYKDKGYSGKNTERPDFQKLVADIESGMIEKLVVYKLDRVSRNITDFYNFYEILKAHDCAFVSYTESFDTSNSMGRAMMGILAVFAQMERENIQTRIKDNYDYRITTKGWLSGKAPFGYKNSKQNGIKVLEPVVEELEVVRWMFKTYAERPNISLGQMQLELNSKGIKGHQSSVGMSRTTINRILSNPVYAVADQMLYEYYSIRKPIFINDKSEWNGTACACMVGKNNTSMRADSLEGVKLYLTTCTGVVDSRTFIMVQDRLSQNSAVASDNRPTNNLKELSGLLKCGKCGMAVKMQAYPTLTCTGRNQKRICDVSFKGLKLEQLQELVSVEVCEYLKTIHEKQRVKQNRRKKTRKQIKDLEGQLEALIETASFSKNVASVLGEKIDTISKQIDKLQLELKMDVDARDLIEIRTDTISIFDNEGNLLIDYEKLDTEKRQVVLRALVQKILIFDDGSIKIIWK